MNNLILPNTMRNRKFSLCKMVLVVFVGFCCTFSLNAKSIEEYHAELSDAHSEGDYQKVFELGRQMAKEYPDIPDGYYAMMILVSKTQPQNEKDLDDVQWAINCFIRKKFNGYDLPAFTMIRRSVFSERSRLALEKGNSLRAISELKKIKSLGDPGSIFYSDLMLAMTYVSKCLKSSSVSDAKAARAAAYSAVKNETGLNEYEQGNDVLNAQLYFIVGCMDNEVGKYSGAVEYLEMANRLSPTDPDIAQALETAKANLNGGHKRFLSIKDIFDGLKSLVGQ